MKCRKVQDILMTDYHDGELRKEERVLIDEHIKKCSGCRSLAEKINAVSGDIFSEKIPEKIPEHVWFNINERISERNDPVQLFRERIRSFFVPVKPVFVYAGLAVVMFVFSVGIKGYLNAKSLDPTFYVESEIVFLDSGGKCDVLSG